MLLVVLKFSKYYPPNLKESCKIKDELGHVGGKKTQLFLKNV